MFLFFGPILIIDTLEVNYYPNKLLFQCGDVAAEEIWYKFGLGQVLRDFFDDTCEHIMDVCIYYLDPAVKQNTPDSKLFQPNVG